MVRVYVASGLVWTTASEPKSTLAGATEGLPDGGGVAPSVPVPVRVVSRWLALLLSQKRMIPLRDPVVAGFNTLSLHDALPISRVIAAVQLPPLATRKSFGLSEAAVI